MRGREAALAAIVDLFQGLRLYHIGRHRRLRALLLDVDLTVLNISLELF